jgi:hypothetical protein
MRLFGLPTPPPRANFRRCQCSTTFNFCASSGIDALQAGKSSRFFPSFSSGFLLFPALFNLKFNQKNLDELISASEFVGCAVLHDTGLRNFCVIHYAFRCDSKELGAQLGSTSFLPSPIIESSPTLPPSLVLDALQCQTSTPRSTTGHQLMTSGSSLALQYSPSHCLTGQLSVTRCSSSRGFSMCSLESYNLRISPAIPKA